MELLELQYFVTVADAGNFARAATLLGINTSTISRRISHLDDELGLTVFERKRSGARLTEGGKAVLQHVRRALAEIEEVRSAGFRNGSGSVGVIRFGLNIPPTGEPLNSLLAAWRKGHPEVLLSIAELSCREICSALEGRRLDAALLPSFMLWPHAAALPVYRELLGAALPVEHPLSARSALDWASFVGETILVQGWAGSEAQREFFGLLLGSGVQFQSHAASGQSLLALVSAGFGVTIIPLSQSQTSCPGVIFKPIDEPNAWWRIDLAWMPEVEEPVVGRFIAFVRDEARARHLL
jgi:DNA-binding transcriptional LysR family regulator